MNAYVRADIRYIRQFGDKCCAEVSRKGEAQPCEKMAVAVAVGDEQGGSWWPVCPHHSRGRAMVSLTELIGALDTEGKT